MAEDRSKNGSGAQLPTLVSKRLIMALSHDLRQHILLAAIAEEVSPSELSRALHKRLATVSYHVRFLHKDCDGLLEQTRTEPRRGATEHYYRATAKSLFPAEAWGGLEGGMRAVVGAGQASDLFDDLAEALTAGKLQGENDHFVRFPLVLDAEGERNVRAIRERAVSEIEAEQQAVARRLRKAKDAEAIGYVVGLVGFEAAWNPADLHASARHPRGRVRHSSGASRDGGDKGI
jgi:hypothetical protein